ncbi:MAG TPA: DUF1257 domain-containing protein [Lentisphaeria bacterium]|nr:DUF1257 domain-containing protein [Lentisphaeria bacterium]
MSHFTRMQTVIRDQVVLAESLRQLHYHFQEGERVLIRGYAGNKEYGQVVINTGSDFDIGFQRQADESFQICADWWGVQKDTSLRQENFLRQVNQTYAHLKVKRQVLEDGYIIEEERVLENGEIELVVSERL